MAINQTLSMESHAAIFSAPWKQELVKQTVADLIDDKIAMAAWTSNIEKIRQRESEVHTKHSS